MRLLTTVNRREKIFNVVKVSFATKKKKNLPIYGIKSKDLREFMTTEKDVEKGVSRIPLQLARIYEEDVMEELDTQPSSTSTSEPGSEMDFTKNMEHRNQARKSTRGSMTPADVVPMLE